MLSFFFFIIIISLCLVITFVITARLRQYGDNNIVRFIIRARVCCDVYYANAPRVEKDARSVSLLYEPIEAATGFLTVRGQ